MVELVSLAERDVIKPVVSNRFKLDQAGEALQMLKDGKIVGRGVINPWRELCIRARDTTSTGGDIIAPPENIELIVSILLVYLNIEKEDL